MNDSALGDFVRLLGAIVLKLVTLGVYRSGPNGLFLEGGLGLAIVSTTFFLLSRFVL